MDFDPSQFLAMDMSEDQNAIYTAPDVPVNLPTSAVIEGGLQLEENVQIPVPVFDTLNLNSHVQEDVMEFDTNEGDNVVNESFFVDTSTTLSDSSPKSQVSPVERTSSPHERKRTITTTPSETSFRKEFYCGNYERVKLFRLHCTVCDLHLGCAPWLTERQMRMHKLLNVAVCRRCFDFYGDINFPIQDETEIYCCWCGEGGEVFCCSQCPKIVCKKCVIRNFGKDKVKEIQENDNWMCYVCEPTAIWPHRALFMGLQRLGRETRQKVASFEKEQRIMLLSQDKSHCCLKMNEQVPEISLPRKSIMSKIPLCLIANVHQAAVRNQPDLPTPRNSFINTASRLLMNSMSHDINKNTNNNNIIQRVNPPNLSRPQSVTSLQQVRIQRPFQNLGQSSLLLNKMFMQKKTVGGQQPRTSFNTQQQIIVRNQQKPYSVVNRSQVSSLANAPTRAIRSVHPIQHSNQHIRQSKSLQHTEIINLDEDSTGSPAKQYGTKQSSSLNYDISFLEKGVKDIRGALAPITLMMDNFALSSVDMKQDFSKLTNFSERLTHNIKIAICSLAKINEDIMSGSKCAIDNNVSKVVRDIQVNGLSLINMSAQENNASRSNIKTPTPITPTTKAQNRTTATLSNNVGKTPPTSRQEESGEEEFNPALLCETVIQEVGNKETQNNNSTKPKSNNVMRPVAQKRSSFRTPKKPLSSANPSKSAVVFIDLDDDDDDESNESKVKKCKPDSYYHNKYKLKPCKVLLKKL